MRLTLWLFAAALAAGETSAPTTLDLPAPHKTGGMPVMEALSKRATARAFDSQDLSTQQLSNLLWAAFGVNRPDGKRTAPSAMNFQETDIYVLLKQGAYVYDAKANRLTQVLAEDIRALGGKQDFVKDAPVTLVFVADFAKMGKGGLEQHATASIDVGFISQNVYLYCASEGLATGVRLWVDQEALGKRLGLRPDQHVIAAQSVGYQKK
jgi:SagB-type dehydrogenase family enzyme